MSLENQLIRKDYPDGIVEIRLNRAPVNAVSPQFLTEFAKLLDDLAADDAVRAVDNRT